MNIREIQNKNVWEDFLLSCEQKTFLSSWNWGEFQEVLRGKIWRFGFYQNGELVSVALAVKISAKRGIFLLVPHGPVAREGISFSRRKEVLETLFAELKKIAKEEDVAFIRINPIWPRNNENTKIFSNLGFRLAPIQMHPEASWKLDISLAEDKLMADMRKTTRYLIKQCMKNQDIKIEQRHSVKDIEIFSKMHETTSKRQSFVPFTLNYLKNEFSIFQKDNQIALFFGKYKGEVAAASFVVFWSNVGFYHHAASLPQYAKLSIPYLLQWEAIKEAKRRGCVLYDFWGYVNPETQPRHPWAGPTLFKMGFGGRAYEYVKTQDYPLSKKYRMIYFFEKLRKIKRGL